MSTSWKTSGAHDDLNPSVGSGQMDSQEDERFDDELLEGGASLTALYLAALPSHEARALLSSVPASEQVDHCSFDF